MAMPFDGYARELPVISPGGIVEAASFTSGRAAAPGSWITVLRNNLSDTTQGNNGFRLAGTVTISATLRGVKIRLRLESCPSLDKGFPSKPRAESV
jgi:hypothetical protein